MGCLPNAGGLFQQDRGHLKKMQRVLQASHEYHQKKMEAERSKEKLKDES